MSTVTLKTVRKIAKPFVRDTIRDFGTRLTFDKQVRSAPGADETVSISFESRFYARGVIIPLNRRTRGYTEQNELQTLRPTYTHVALIDPGTLTGDLHVVDTLTVGTTKFKIVGFTDLNPDGRKAIIIEVQLNR